MQGIYPTRLRFYSARTINHSYGFLLTGVLTRFIQFPSSQSTEHRSKSCQSLPHSLVHNAIVPSPAPPWSHHCSPSHTPEVTLSLWKTGESDHGIVAGSVGQADQSHSTTWHFEVTLPNTGAGALPPVPSTLLLGLAEVGQADVGLLNVTVRKGRALQRRQ